MRQIEKKMIEFLDEKLSSHGAAQRAIKEKNPRNLLIYAAEACVGIRESGGRWLSSFKRLSEKLKLKPGACPSFKR